MTIPKQIMNAECMHLKISHLLQITSCLSMQTYSLHSVTCMLILVYSVSTKEIPSKMKNIDKLSLIFLSQMLNIAANTT